MLKFRIKFRLTCLALVILIAAACGKFSNSKREAILECGSELSEPNYIKLTRQDGLPWTKTTQVTATIVSKDWEVRPLKVSPKLCLSFAISSFQSGDSLLIKAKDGDVSFYASVPVQSINGKESLSLQSKVLNRFDWSCPVIRATSQTAVELPTETLPGGNNPYVFRYTIYGSNHGIKRTTTIIRPERVKIMLEDANGTTFLDEHLSIETELFDAVETPLLTNPVAKKLCSLDLDRSAPQPAMPAFLGQRLATSVETFTTVPLGSDFTLENFDDSSHSFYYCFDPVSESGVRLDERCSSPSLFNAYKIGQTLPGSGLWKISYFTEDLAGNRSSIQSALLGMINFDSISAIRTEAALAQIVSSEKRDEAIKAALQSSARYQELKTNLEKSIVTRDLQKSLIAASSYLQSRREISMSRLDNYSFSSDRNQIFTLKDREFAVWDAATLTRLSKHDFPEGDIILLPNRSRILVSYSTHLDIHDTSGELLNRIEHNVSHMKPVVHDTEQSEFLAITLENELVLVRNDSVISRQLLPGGFQSVLINQDGSLQILSIIDNNLIIDHSSKPQERILLNSSHCNASLPIIHAKFSPLGGFLIVESGIDMHVEKRQFLNRQGNLIGGRGYSCGLSDELYAFSNNDAFLTRVIRDDTGSALSLYSLNDGKAKRVFNDDKRKDKIDNIIFRDNSALVIADLSAKIVTEIALDSLSSAALTLPEAIQTVKTSGPYIVIQTRAGLNVWDPKFATGMQSQSFDFIKKVSKGNIGPNYSLIRQTYDTLTLLEQGQVYHLPLKSSGKTYKKNIFSPQGDKAAMLYQTNEEAFALKFWRKGHEDLLDTNVSTVKAQWLDDQRLMSQSPSGDLMVVTFDGLAIDVISALVCGAKKINDFALTENGLILFAVCDGTNLVQAELSSGGWAVTRSTKFAKSVHGLRPSPRGNDVIVMSADQSSSVYWWRTSESEAFSLALDGRISFGGGYLADDSAVLGSMVKESNSRETDEGSLQTSNLVELQWQSEGLILKKTGLNISSDFIYNSELDILAVPDETREVLGFWNRDGTLVGNFNLGRNSSWVDSEKGFLIDFRADGNAFRIATQHSFVTLDFGLAELWKSFCHFTPKLAESVVFRCK